MEGVKPSLTELEKFQEGDGDLRTERNLHHPVLWRLVYIYVLVAATTVTEKAHSFAPGDKVEVGEGELINLRGRVTSVDGDRIVMMPDHEELKVSQLYSDFLIFFIFQEPLTFSAYELKKFFAAGDHVKVIAGRYEGDTGLILRVEENTVFLLSDLTQHEVTTKQ